MDSSISLDDAVELTRTGDLWLFRGRSGADQAIRVITNAPVNHVGMAVVLDDMPPLMWHAELGKGLRDVWTGSHHRGVQLHDLREAVVQWCGRYGQRAWLRQLDATVTTDEENAAAADDRPDRRHAVPRDRRARRLAGPRTGAPARAGAEMTYCAEVVAATYTAMGLLDDARPTNSYDPGSFWSGDDLDLLDGARLGEEIAVRV